MISLFLFLLIFLCHEIIINQPFITDRLQVRATVAALLVSSEAMEHNVLVSFTQAHTNTLGAWIQCLAVNGGSGCGSLSPVLEQFTGQTSALGRVPEKKKT